MKYRENVEVTRSKEKNKFITIICEGHKTITFVHDEVILGRPIHYICTFTLLMRAFKEMFMFRKFEQRRSDSSSVFTKLF